MRMVGAEQREGDVPLDLPPARAVDLSRLGELVGHALEPGEHQQDREAEVLPA